MRIPEAGRPVSTAPQTELLAADSLSALRQDERLLAAFAFNGATAIDGWDARLVHVGLRALGAADRIEVWRSSGPVVCGRHGRIRYAEDGQVLFGHLLATEVDETALADTVRDAYADILRFVRATAYPHLCRCWNFLPAINRIDGQLERYRALCIGRHNAMSDQPDFEAELPAASAIGTQAPGLLLSFIAGRIKPVQVENPRQVSAFRYPPKHGPRSPSFSRAAWMDWRGSPQLYLSGTASIVGHETTHADDPPGQIQETLRNIEATLANAPAGGSVRDRDASLRVYIRHAEHYEAVRRAVGSRWPGASVTYLQGDICRSDLLLEIEGVFG